MKNASSDVKQIKNRPRNMRLEDYAISRKTFGLLEIDVPLNRDEWSRRNCFFRVSDFVNAPAQLNDQSSPAVGLV